MSSEGGGSTPLGTIIYSAVKPIFKIYFIIALGFLLAKRNILTVTTCRDISDCIVTAIMPCLIFNNVVTNLKSSDIKNLGVIFFTGTLLFIIGVGLSILNKILTKSPKRWLGGLLSVGLFPNISDLPIAYLQTLSNGGEIFSQKDGDKGVAYVCIFLAAQVFYQFSLGLYRLIEWDFREELLKEEREEEKNIESHTNTINNDTVQEQRDCNEDAIDDTSITSSFSSNSIHKNNKEISQTRRQSTSRLHPDDVNDQHNEFLRHYELQALQSNPRSTISSGSETSPSHVLSRRGSNQGSISTNYYSLHLQPSIISGLRRHKSEDISDVINEYSEYEEWKNQEIRRIASNETGASTNLTVPTNNGHDEERSKLAKLKMLLIETLKNFAAPNSASLIISIAIAMAPPLKALFVPSNFDIPDAPDSQPPLSFVMDIASYIGAASVPLGLLLLGATISRLQVKKMPKGFWKTAVAVTVSRLIILPIIGVGLTTGFYKGGWYGDDKLIRFVSVLEFGLPSATALVYFTAFYTDPNSDDHLQMDCLAVCLIFQYAILFITLPFLVSFTLKVSLGF
jgi:hypothetical protein